VLKFTAPYAQFVHEGTGLYGPHKTKIVPQNKQALYWTGLSHPVRATKGNEGPTVGKTGGEKVKGDEAYEEGMKNYLKQKGDRMKIKKSLTPIRFASGMVPNLQRLLASSSCVSNCTSLTLSKFIKW